MKIRDKRKLLQEKRDIKRQPILEAVPTDAETHTKDAYIHKNIRTYVHTYTLSKELQRASVLHC